MSPTDLGLSTEGTASSSLTVSATASPAETRLGDSVSVSIGIKNNTSTGIKVLVAEIVLDPSGVQRRSRSWPEQNVAAGKTIMLVDRFATAGMAVAGTYPVGVKVTSRSGTTYHDSRNATTFTLTNPSTTLYQYSRLSDPARTVVRDVAGSWVATFTDGAYTVSLAGATRVFTEPNDTAVVSHATWVRVLPHPFTGQVDEAWLASAQTDQSADVVQVAMQYIVLAPALYNGAGLKIGEDAHYGPLQSDGTRQEGSDFNDYLGIPWKYGDIVDVPEATQINALDCSGFVRMVFGYRAGLPLTIRPDGVSIPRRAFEILDSAPGVVPVPNRDVTVTDFSRLLPGDLVFFDAATDDGTQIDHVGMFLGVDSRGYHRFISSRKSINGPTFGDYQGRSILETISGGGLYAKSFRAVRRL